MKYPYVPSARAASLSERNVEQVLASLDGAELLYARKQLQNFTALWNGFSGFKDLPTEVHLMISDFLDLREVFTCRRVDRAWRTAWKSPALLRQLCRRFFEGLVELAPATSELDALFVRATDQVLGRQLRPIQHTFMPWRDDIPTHSGNGPVSVHPEDGHDWFYRGPSKVLYRHERMACKAEDDGRWDVEELRIPSPRIRCKCKVEGEPPLSSYQVRRRERHYFTERALQGYHNEVVGISKELVALYERGMQFGDHQEHRLRVWHTTLDSVKEMNLPGPIMKAHVNHESVLVMLEDGNSILSYEWGGILRDVPVQVKHFPEDSEADSKLHLDLGSPQHTWVHPHKPIKIGPSVMYHPRDRNVFYLVWRYRQTLLDSAVSSIEIVKYVDNQPVQHFYKDGIRDLALEGPRRGRNRSQCQSLEDHITYVQFGCEPVSEFGLYTIFTQGSPPGHVYRGTANPRCSKCLDQDDMWRVICFNVCTERFSDRSYRPTSVFKFKPRMLFTREDLAPLHEYSVRVWGAELWVCGTILYIGGRFDYVRRYIEEDFGGLPIRMEDEPQSIIEAHEHMLLQNRNSIAGMFVDAKLMIVHSKDGMFLFHWDKGDNWVERPLWPWEEVLGALTRRGGQAL